MLPRIRKWLDDLEIYQERLQAHDERVSALMADGNDAGGEAVNQFIKTLARCQSVLAEFRVREIQLKDWSRGLIDFPSLREGREVFLCWEKDEEDIEFWHDLEAGYQGREKI